MNLVTYWAVALLVDAANRLPKQSFPPSQSRNNPRPRRYLFSPRTQNSKNSESSLQNNSYPSLFPQTIVQKLTEKNLSSPSYSSPFITFLHLLSFMQILQSFMQILTKSFMEILQSFMQILTLINYFKINCIIFVFNLIKLTL